MHRRALLGQDDGDDAAGRAGSEEPLGQELDRGRLGALAHADQDAAVPDHEHVASLE
jgi:hypothetical protein